MADDRATFAIVLEDETSGVAAKAAKALEDLKSKIDADTKALSQMQKAMRQMKAGGLKASDAFKDMSAKADAMKVQIGASQSKFASLGGEFGKQTPKAEAAAKAIGVDLGDALNSAGGPAAKLNGVFSKLGGLLANPITLVIALAAGFVALAAAIVTATAALLKFGISQSDARRNEALAIEGLNTLREQYGRSTASVEEFQTAIDAAADSTNIGRGTLQTYARQLSRAGLRGDALTKSVEAMGIAAMVQGDRGANRFRALATATARAGGDVRALAEDYRARLGPIARRQMLSIDNQTQRLSRSLDRIFSGLNIDPFLDGLEDMQSLLSQSTFTGRALKLIAETLLQPLVDSIAVVGPIMKRFFQGFVIGGLIATVGILRVKSALADLFGDDFASDFNFAKAALFAGIAAFVLFAVVVGAAALAVGLLVGFMAVFAATALAVPIAIGAIAVALVGMIKEAVAFWSDFDFAALGKSMIDGIVEGLTTGDFANAVFDLANDAQNAFKRALGISSPSSVFAGFGENIAEGAALGIASGTPAVDDAVGALVDAPTGGGLGGATSISIGDVTVNAGQSSNPRELAVAFRDELASILEGVNVEVGSPT